MLDACMVPLVYNTYAAHTDLLFDFCLRGNTSYEYYFAKVIFRKLTYDSGAKRHLVGADIFIHWTLLDVDIITFRLRFTHITLFLLATSNYVLPS